MNLSLTLNFDSVAELQEFLDNQSVAALVTEAVVGGPPGATSISAAAPLKAVPEVVDIDPLATADDAVVDPDLRATLLARLRVIAAGMEDSSVLGTFITGFGVTKFSDIADEDLPAFETALNKKFKA